MSSFPETPLMLLPIQFPEALYLQLIITRSRALLHFLTIQHNILLSLRKDLSSTAFLCFQWRKQTAFSFTETL